MLLLCGFASPSIKSTAIGRPGLDQGARGKYGDIYRDPYARFGSAGWVERFYPKRKEEVYAYPVILDKNILWV